MPFIKSFTAFIIAAFLTASASAQDSWTPSYVFLNKEGLVQYNPDAKGNNIPDFSRVGFQSGEKVIPHVQVVKTIEASNDFSEKIIQSAIDEVAKMPLDKDGFRGAILLKKGVYKIHGTLKISVSGIVLRGEGAETKLIAAGAGKRNLVVVAGNGAIKENGKRIKIVDDYVPLGAKSFNLISTQGLKPGDKIVVYRPGTTKWIHDLKMDQIEVKDQGTKQWQPEDYDLHFERVITRIDQNKIFIDNPIVMAMEAQYGGGEIYPYSFAGRINNAGIENLLCESEFASDTDEDHGWNAIFYDRVEHGWIRNVTAKHFGYSAVNLGSFSKNITVDSCNSLSPKSKVTGGRRYSFNNDGQLNLVMNCFASEGRHDYVTGKTVRGPNVFYNCRSEKASSDIGPHHRLSVGTLYDNIITDGEINIQDRGNWGTGHGWAGVNQVIWNCVAAKAAVQDPWVSGKNYVIGLKASRNEGRLKGRIQTIWENSDGNMLTPVSLFKAQLQSQQLLADRNK